MCMYALPLTMSFYLTPQISEWKSLSCVWFFVTPMDYTVHGISRPEYWSCSLSLLQGIFPTLAGIEPRYPTLQTDSLPAEPQGKHKNMGVGSLSLLSQVFTTQELNWGLLHCRQIPYQLNNQGKASPNYMQFFYIVRLILFPLWLAVVITFYFLVIDCEN